MDLEQFVSETLRQILNGVSKAKQDDNRVAPVVTGEDIGEIPRTYGDRAIFYAEFDVAVTVSEKSEKEGGGGIQVLGMVSAKGGAASAHVSESVSRVKFKVPLDISAPKSDSSVAGA